MTDDRRQYLEMQISAYLDDELGPEERREVESLLERDADARTLLDALRATIEAVQSLPRARAPAHLMESLRSQMEREALLGAGPVDARPHRRGRAYLRWMTAAAVLALATTTGYLMWPIAQDHWRLPGPLASGERRTPSPVAPELSEGLDKGAHLRPDPNTERVAEGEEDRERLMAKTESARPSTVEPAVSAVADKDVPAQVVLGEGAQVPEGHAPAEPAEDMAGAKAAVAEEELLAARGAELDHDAYVAGATVVKLAFADVSQCRDAAARVQSRFAFRSADEAKTQPQDVATALFVEVPTEQEARQIVSEIRSSFGDAYSVQVSAAGVPTEDAVALGRLLPARGAGDVGTRGRAAERHRRIAEAPPGVTPQLGGRSTARIEPEVQAGVPAAAPAGREVSREAPPATRSEQRPSAPPVRAMLKGDVPPASAQAPDPALGGQAAGGGGLTRPAPESQRLPQGPVGSGRIEGGVDAESRPAILTPPLAQLPTTQPTAGPRMFGMPSVVIQDAAAGERGGLGGFGSFGGGRAGGVGRSPRGAGQPVEGALSATRPAGSQPATTTASASHLLLLYVYVAGTPAEAATLPTSQPQP